PGALGPSPRPTGADDSEALPASSRCPSANMDAKTMETAEKLARFVAQVGPEIEQFSIENSTDNPDLCCSAEGSWEVGSRQEPRQDQQHGLPARCSLCVSGRLCPEWGN
ncbi:splicing factor, arginine/serine-rich 14, isoform CRA_a, partial [Mus musculus]